MITRRLRIAALIATGLVLLGLALYVGTLAVLTGAIQPGPRASSALPTIAPSAPSGYTTTSRGGFQRTTDGGLHWVGLRPPGGP